MTNAMPAKFKEEYGTGPLGKFFGEPIEDMERDELLAIIGYLSSELAKHNSPDARIERILGATERLKRSA